LTPIILSFFYIKIQSVLKQKLHQEEAAFKLWSHHQFLIQAIMGTIIAIEVKLKRSRYIVTCKLEYLIHLKKFKQ